MLELSLTRACVCAVCIVCEYVLRVLPGWPLSVHLDRGTLSYKTRTKALRSGNHGPRARTPQTGPEPPRAGPGSLQVEAGPPGGLSHQASHAQASGPPLPTRAGVRSRHVPLWARPPTPGSGAATCPTGADLRTSAPRSGRGPEPPRTPVGAAADPWVRCRHVSHRRESST